MIIVETILRVLLPTFFIENLITVMLRGKQDDE